MAESPKKDIVSLDESFWARNPKEVARDLMGYAIGHLGGDNYPLTYGHLIEVGAFEEGPRQAEIFAAAPGTLATFPSYGKKTAVIAAHTQRGKGVVTLRSACLTMGASAKSSDICKHLKIDEFEGEVISTTNVFVARDTMLLGMGWKVYDRMPAKAPENMLANYLLVRE